MNYKIAALKDISFDFLTDELRKYIEEVKFSEKLSKEEFENRYEQEMILCKNLGKAGWVISEHSNPKYIKQWGELLVCDKGKDVTKFFEDESGRRLNCIVDKLSNEHCFAKNLYFLKGLDYFLKEDYMTSAIYFVALIESHMTKLLQFPNGMKYKQKYSEQGFREHLEKEFVKTNSFVSKRFLFLNMYPSIIAFLERLFVDGEYKFEENNEPPYVNRNWLLHGRNNREIERFECIQLINALSVINFVFGIANNAELTY